MRRRFYLRFCLWLQFQSACELAVQANRISGNESPISGIGTSATVYPSTFTGLLNRKFTELRTICEWTLETTYGVYSFL